MHPLYAGPASIISPSSVIHPSLCQIYEQNTGLHVALARCIMCACMGTWFQTGPMHAHLGCGAYI